jgi:hypothetical protein
MACRPSRREVRRRAVRSCMTRTASRRRDPIRQDASQVSLPRLWRGVVLLGLATMTRREPLDPGKEMPSMRANSWYRAAARCLPMVMVLAAASLSGCKSMTERYIALEVWKYEKLFGHLPPGFVPPGAMPAAAPAMRPCGQQAPCQGAPCGSGDHVVGSPMAGDNCHSCQGGVVEGGMPSGAIMAPGVPAGALPVGPGGSPGPSAGMPTPAAVSSSRPVVISDEVVLP